MRRWAALVMTAVLASACGSTVATTSSVTRPGTEQEAGVQGLTPQGVATSSSGQLTGSTTTTGRSGSAASGSAGALGAGAGSTSPGTSGGGGAAGGPANGPGVTATTITIGIAYYENAAAANAAMGAGGVKTSDPVAGTRVIVDDINRHGGIAGRKLSLLTYGIDPQSPSPYASSAQAMCTYFTQDHKVFAVLDGAPSSGVLARPCLDKHGVLYLGGLMLSTDDYVSGELDPLTLSWNHMFAVLPGLLGKQGWFGGWNHATASAGTLPVKTGILTVDRPALSRAVDGVLIPGLRRQGHAPASADVIRIAPPNGFGDDGNVVASIHGAVLKFRADGVTHVILTDANGSMSLLFLNDATSQGYYPRLGGSTGNGWQALLTAGSLQAKSLNGAMGVGWNPLLDLPYREGDGAYSTPARHACFQLFARSGTYPQDGNTASSMAAGCDVAYLLPRALQGYVGPLSRSVVLQHVAALGSSLPTAATLGLRFAPDKRDGIGRYTALVFGSGCSCFSYVGTPAGV